MQKEIIFPTKIFSNSFFRIFFFKILFEFFFENLFLEIFCSNFFENVWKKMIFENYFSENLVIKNWFMSVRIGLAFFFWNSNISKVWCQILSLQISAQISWWVLSLGGIWYLFLFTDVRVIGLWSWPKIFISQLPSINFRWFDFLKNSFQKSSKLNNFFHTKKQFFRIFFDFFFQKFFRIFFPNFFFLKFFLIFFFDNLREKMIVIFIFHKIKRSKLIHVS